MTRDEIVRRIAAESDGVGLFLDFDGVLAPIVANPSDSAMTQGLSPVLSRIASRVSVLALVSGRPAAFLADRTDIDGARLLGVYGTQEWRDGRAVPRAEIAEWEPALDDARGRITAALVDHPGVRFEDKDLAVAVHWRQAPDHAAAAGYVEQLLTDIAAATGLAVEPGKLVMELRPPLAWDKGTTVALLLEQHQVVLPVYAGDDLGDLAAFRAVRSAGGITIAVEHGEETPAELRHGADIVLDGTDGVASWLHELDAALER